MVCRFCVFRYVLGFWFIVIVIVWGRVVEEDCGRDMDFFF